MALPVEGTARPPIVPSGPAVGRAVRPTRAVAGAGSAYPLVAVAATAPAISGPIKAAVAAAAIATSGLIKAAVSSLAKGEEDTAVEAVTVEAAMVEAATGGTAGALTGSTGMEATGRIMTALATDPMRPKALSGSTAITPLPPPSRIPRGGLGAFC